MKTLNRIVRVSEISAITGLAPSTIQGKQNPNSNNFDETFPAAVRLGKRALGFRLFDIEEWLTRNTTPVKDATEEDVE